MVMGEFVPLDSGSVSHITAAQYARALAGRIIVE
jgi:hypothetical protein